jgi:hypothetical protein
LGQQVLAYLDDCAGKRERFGDGVDVVQVAGMTSADPEKFHGFSIKK